MVRPIRIHASDTETTIRMRHKEIEDRLEVLGADQVRLLMANGGLPPGWHVIAAAWLAGDRLEPEGGGT